MYVCVCVLRLYYNILLVIMNRVNNNGAAAKVMIFDNIGEKDTPWHFREEKRRLTGVPKRSLRRKT